MSRRTLIPNVQSLAMSNEGSPHILAGQSFAHLPRFVEHRNGAIGLDLPNEVDASCGHGQRIGQVLPFPEGMGPQAIQLFDLAIGLGFGDGQENELEADTLRETQPNKPTEDTWGFVSPTKSSIVVELQKAWNPKGFPAFQDVGDDRLAALVGGNGLRAGASA